MTRHKTKEHHVNGTTSQPLPSIIRCWIEKGNGGLKHKVGNELLTEVVHMLTSLCVKGFPWARKAGQREALVSMATANMAALKLLNFPVCYRFALSLVSSLHYSCDFSSFSGLSPWESRGYSIGSHPSELNQVLS